VQVWLQFLQSDVALEQRLAADCGGQAHGIEALQVSRIADADRSLPGPRWKAALRVGLEIE
jgi:hypothetical protein